MEFMTIEGDRSGVEIPTHHQKASNIVHAMIQKLSNREDYTLDQIYDALVDLNRARLHLEIEKYDI